MPPAGRRKRAGAKTTELLSFKGDQLNNDDDTPGIICDGDGKRTIEPYYFSHSTHCKQRWFGRSLLDVYSGEYRNFTTEYYRKAILDGRIRVNNRPVQPDYLLQNSDYVTHRTHRHEPPIYLLINGGGGGVSADSDQTTIERDIIEKTMILYEDDELIAVNKPATIPVHPCGQHRHNSLSMLLSSYYGGKSVHALHRLDKVTSGVLLLAKTTEAAKEYAQFMRTEVDDDGELVLPGPNADTALDCPNNGVIGSKVSVRKEYVCRVSGRFPDGQVQVQMPLMSVCRRLGVNMCVPIEQGGKPSVTRFERIAYNGEESLVKCYPVTGRTHQIRVHLRWLGHPISNDELYKDPLLWSTASDDSQMIGPEEMNRRCLAYLKREAEIESNYISKVNGGSCPECGEQGDGKPPAMIWLHAHRYILQHPVLGEREFKAPLPEWANFTGA